LAVAIVAGAAVLGGGAALYLRPASPPIGIDETIASRATVAIMPFVVASGDPRLRGFADAVADGITAEVASRFAMRGIGRAATAPFDGAAPPLERIGAALKAPLVLTGGVAPVGGGERVAIDVQIIRVANGEVIWSRHFVASNAADPAVVSDVGQHVANAVRSKGAWASWGSWDRPPEPGHVPDAADQTLMGWSDLYRRKSLADVRRARGRFEAAVRQDPRSVVALNGLSASYLMERNDPLGQLTPAQVAEHERVVNLASSLAPDNDATLVLWGNVQLLRGRPDLALPAFEKANRRVPSNHSHYVDVAHALLLLGRAGEVQAFADRSVALGVGDARRVSPAYLIAAEAALFLGEDERAHDLARRAIAEWPSNARAHATLAAIEALAGRDELARSEMAAFLKLWPAATLARYDETHPSTHPVYLAQRVRLYEGLRKAGLPER
jgi:TolB-like protein/tetratricopeptide (TPR) repeat protein